MYKNTWRHVTKDGSLNIHRREFLGTHCKVQCPNSSSYGSSAMASSVFFYCIHSSVLPLCSNCLHETMWRHPCRASSPHVFRFSPAGPLPPRLQLRFRNRSSLPDRAVNPMPKSQRGGQRFKFTTLGQQNALTCSLDIYITMSHWIFPHFAARKGPSLGNYTNLA
jgi:hypothetical protein